jgi:pimeloyl-ACP methyl ester carboxylesterase
MNARLSGYPSGLPITYVSMTLDAPVPPPLAQQMAANLGPEARLEVVPEAGHTIMTTHPQRIAAILDRAAAAV